MDIISEEYEQRAKAAREMAKKALPKQRPIIEQIAETWEKLAIDRRRDIVERNGGTLKEPQH